MRLLHLLPFVIFGVTAIVLLGAHARAEDTAATRPVEKVVKSDAEWKRILTPEQYYILRQEGTERPFRNAYWDNHEPGTYVCAGCGLTLFSSEQKFDSGTGWPSYYDMAEKGHVLAHRDPDGRREALVCARCEGHLGHVFDDGPKPTGLRYCIDSGAMKFVPKGK